MRMTLTLRGLWAFSIVLIAGCPDKENDSESGTTTEATTSAPTTGETATTTTGETTTTEATTTATATTAEPTTTDATTDATTGAGACEADSTLEESCAQVCAQYVACDDQIDLAGCTESCVADAFKDTPACECGAIEWADCRAALDCEALQGTFFAADAPCFTESTSYLIHCGDCYTQPQDTPPGVCALIVECPDIFGISFLCQDGTCTCNDDKGEFKSCPDPGLCDLDQAAFAAAATECCGVPF